MEEFGSSHEQRNHIYIVLYSIISIRNNATVFCIYLFKNIKQMTQILKNRFVKKVVNQCHDTKFTFPHVENISE